jgi:hypothetical protein
MFCCSPSDVADDKTIHIDTAAEHYDAVPTGTKVYCCCAPGGDADPPFALREDRTCMVKEEREELEPPREFAVQLQRPSAGTSYNIGVSTCTGTELIIIDVKDGPGNDWNKDNPNLALMLFDRIVEVNGVKGTPEPLMKELTDAKAAELLIRRPRVISIALSKGTDGRALGLGISSLDNSPLLIVHEVCVGGIVEEWNLAHPGQKVLRGDRVKSVNGIDGDSTAILDVIAKAASLALVLQRH